MAKFKIKKVVALLFAMILIVGSFVGCSNDVTTVSENVSQSEALVDKTEEPSQMSTQIQTEESTQGQTEAKTETPTEKSTEAQTEESTEKSTEAQTEGSTEKSTEAQTEESTEKSTEAQTEAPIQTEVVEIVTQGPVISDGEYLKDWGMQSLELQNQKRAEAGLPALEWNEELYQQILVRGPEIQESFSHTRPNGESCFTAVSMGYRSIGENIACGQRSPAEVTKGWFNSQGHRENMLRSSYTSAAVVCYRVQNDPKGYTYYWITMFHG